MMQVQKEFIKAEITRVAKKEFLSKGFQKASLREIAKEVGATTGIIYTYFKNKDELFKEVVDPALEFAKHRFHDLQDLEVFKRDLSLGIVSDTEDSYFPFTSIVENFRDELFLLMYRSAGSQFDAHFDKLIEMKSIQYYNNLEKMRKSGAKLKMQISPHFLRIPVKLIFAIIGEMVYKNMTREELIEYERKALPFLRNAWSSIF
ncbi:MAG: TetR/AcrR family transcriptional regulator [Hyphomicrobiales bacterium]